MPLEGEKHVVTVEIEPPADVVEAARQRAGENESIEPYLLDAYLFEYEWRGVGIDG